LLRVRDGGTTDQGALISADDLAATARPSATAESALGAEVLGLREWAEDQAATGGVGDRDDAPAHSDRAWHQVSVPARECLGAQRCPQGDSCLVEVSRDRARSASLVVTNHALLAIDAMQGGTAVPEHKAVIVDEAHELVARVTGAASGELSPQQVERVGKRAVTFLSDETALDLLEAADDRWNASRTRPRPSSRPWSGSGQRPGPPCPG
jgi:ATP-dependent DNA helicase DinG